MKRCTDKRIGQSIALYEFGALEGRELSTFLDHLVECEYCYDQVYSIEPFSKAFRNHRARARRDGANVSFIAAERNVQARRAWWSWQPAITIAASLLIAIGIGAIIFTERLPGNGTAEVTGEDKKPLVLSSADASPWIDLEVPKASYVPPEKRVVLRGPAEAFNKAMEAYQADDFAGALAQLEPLSELEPENASEVKFYCGVTLLLTGRNQDAISLLRQATQFSVGPRLESSHYYLALAYLKCNYPDEALNELEAVINMKATHRLAAEELKRQILASRR